MIVHGIPGEYRATEGDILSVDVGVTLDGFVADSACDVPGRRDLAPRRSACSTSARRRSRPGSRRRASGRRVGDISAAVQTATEEAGFCVIRSLVGHGVGRSITRTRRCRTSSRSYRGPELREGMTIAIEPMITAGGPDVYVHDDEWSISTADGSLAAHFEHTVAITAEGPRVLTTAREGPGTMTRSAARAVIFCGRTPARSE